MPRTNCACFRTDQQTPLGRSCFRSLVLISASVPLLLLAASALATAEEEKMSPDAHVTTSVLKDISMDHDIATSGHVNANESTLQVTERTGDQTCSLEDSSERCVDGNNRDGAPGDVEEDNEDSEEEEDEEDEILQDLENEELCKDWEEDCRSWADSGECEKTPEYMFDHCPLSCSLCELQRDSLEYGAMQEISGNGDEILSIVERLKEVNHYMFDEVWVEPEYEDVRDVCQNTDQLCTYWAAEGLCEGEEREWMTDNCAPACQFCHLLHPEVKCPLPDPREASVRAGYWKDIFERLTDADSEYAKYKPTLVSRAPDDEMEDEFEIDDEREAEEEAAMYYYGPDDEEEDMYDPIPPPWIASFDSFLTEEECRHMIKIGADIGYERSGEQSPHEDGSVEEIVSDSRTSENTWVDFWEDPVASRIMDRIVGVTGLSRQNAEDYQLLRYEPGQYYDLHHDNGALDFKGPCGPRVLTFFLYLNDVEEGGGTRFPDVVVGDDDGEGMVVMPKMGKAVMWTNVMDVDDTFPRDEGTFHEALPVERGQKFAANIWFHLYDWQSNVKRGCECE